MNSSTLKSYLTGLILGDGYIDHGVAKRAFRIKSVNKDFIQKIEKDLKKSTNFNISVMSHRAEVKADGVNHREYQELSISAHPYFSKIYHKFYNDFGKRTISKSSLEDLEWEGWANWFMSDGYTVKVGKESGVIKDRRVDLCTDRYSETDVDMLVSFVSKTFGYKVSKIKRGNVFRVRIGLKDAQYFFCNISPFVVSSFLYKLDMSYDYRPTWMTDEYYELMQNIHQCQPPDYSG